MTDYTENIKKFPIYSHLDFITKELKSSPTRFLILTAETAAGKSTILPLKLIEENEKKNSDKKILMTEPRRLAVLGTASRLSDLRGEKCGATVGYKIHLDKKVSNDTKMEVVTEAILVRQLQSDPVLEDYNIVILDEFHERSVNVDLALAFLKEAMMLRDDLYVIIMSATIDTDKIKSYLGDETPVVKAEGRQFPVKVFYDDKTSIENVILNQYEKNKDEKNILVFLPGIKEIRRTEENLKQIIDPFSNIKVYVLHSSISLNEQKKILKDDENEKRIILSSAIAETSLTVPGVTSVIDSGLSRINRIDNSSGVEILSTETESEFSSDQRKGRAGRLREGECIRLWNKADPRIKDMPCEILRCDLTSLVLECSERGVYNYSSIDWLTPPSSSSWNNSVFLLQALGLVNKDNHITEKGKRALKLGVHPRVASIALAIFSKNKKASSKEKALLIKYSGYGKSSLEIQNRFLDDIEKRVLALKKDDEKTIPESLLLLEGYPDRIGKRISPIGEVPEVYKLPNGRNVILKDGEHGSEWIVAPTIITGSVNTVIFEFENLDEKHILNWLSDKTTTEEECVFDSEKKLRKTQNTCYGKIVISSKAIKTESSDYIKAWCNDIKENGLSSIPYFDKTASLLIRFCFYVQNTKKDFTFRSGKVLSYKKECMDEKDIEKVIFQNVSKWLPVFFTEGSKLTKEMVYDALYYELKGETIDEEVFEILNLPNGKRTKVKYEKLAAPDDKNKLIIRPVIEIIIQRIFGCFETPSVLGVKALLRLLSPARRPLQITDDLEGFWNGAWKEICKEMKGRYPKHNWDEKVCTEKD